jgi:hypothetical protein
MKERMIPLRLADQAVAACEAELQKLRAENVALKKSLEKANQLIGSGGYETVDQVIAVDKAREAVASRVAKRKPATKTPQGWRKMSSVPHGVEVEVKFTTDGTISSPAVKARVDDHGFYIDKVYWARFAPDGTDRLAAWRPLK